MISNKISNDGLFLQIKFSKILGLIFQYKGTYMAKQLKASISLIKQSNDRLKNGYRTEKRYTENLTYSEINTLLKTAFYNTFNNSKKILE